MYASASTTIKIHDFTSRNVVINYQPTSKVEGPIRSISWSRDGTWLVLVPHSGVTEIVAIKDQLKLLKTIQDIEEPTCACFQKTTKKNVALGSQSGLVVIYDVKSRCVRKRFPRASSQIVLLDFTAKDTHCIAGCLNGEVLVYGNITNSPPSVLKVPKSSTINCLKTNQAKRQLVLGGSNEGVVVVWDINVSKRKFFAEAHKAPVNAVAFSPVNTDLIVSAGSDRQFSFYDTLDNNCIASVAVENSITAVDFSPDGTHFVMASQNGKVHTYDSRNIQVPVHSFQAHASAIRHLAFQHVQVTGNSSPCSISSDSVTPIPSTEGNGNGSSTTSLSGLFPGVPLGFVPNIESAEEDARSVGSMEGGDSFMAALGLDKSSTIESMKQEDGVPQFRSRLSSIADVPSPGLATATRRLTGGFKENRVASTPKRLSLDINTDVSPVVDKRMLGNFASSFGVRAVVKEELDVVKKELEAMYVASASTTIKFHEFPSGNVVHNYQPGSKVEGPLRSISWSKDGSWLVLVPQSGVTEIVSIKDQLKLLKTIQDIEEPTCACFQNTTKKNVAMGSKSGLVVIYDVKSRCTKKRFPRASSHVTHLDFTAKDTHCVAGCKNGEVLVYGNVTNSPPSILRVPKSSSITCLKTNQSKRQLVLGGSNEGIVVVWDINISRSKFFAEAHKAPVNAVAFSPVNSDLIVTAGSDRQFNFYDIVDNKCIASVAVENSVTAVDFSPDGTYFVMGSQNGRVYIYDSRNIQEPMHSFQAHKSAVKHLAFQNVHDTGNSSSCSISTDSITPVPTSEANRNSRSGRTSDLFGLFIPTADSTDEGSKSMVSMEGGDSFMAALGLDKGNTTESMKQDDSFFQIGDRLPSIADMPSPSLPKTSKRELGDFKENQFASTPKLLNVNTNAAVSPIVHNGVLGGGSLASSSEVRAIVKEELKGMLNELKGDIKYQATHTTYQLRSLLLDMHMAQVKEFIKLEDCFTQIRKDLNHEGYDSGSLVEENAQLRRRVVFLEEQLKHSSKGGGSSDT